jgi:hypothetical protein
MIIILDECSLLELLGRPYHRQSPRECVPRKGKKMQLGIQLDWYLLASSFTCARNCSLLSRSIQFIVIDASLIIFNRFE